MELPIKRIKSETPLGQANILAYAPPKFGKCLKGDTVISQPESGRPITIRELVKNKTGDVFTMKKAGIIARQNPTAYLTNEPAQLFRLSTKTGRSIEATANHPFLTREGWKQLHELRVGSRVAIVTKYPSFSSARDRETQQDRVEPVFFDRVISVEPTVVEEVYDLTVENSHNFIANDFIVHNSSFASQFPNVLFLATEPGLNQIECYKIDIRSWKDMREAYTLLKKGEHNFKTIVVDTIDNAFQFCAQETCDKFGVAHENEVPYGAASGQINNNFYRFLMLLTQLPYTVILISHEQQKEVDFEGKKIKKAVPSLSTKNAEKITGLVDVILYGQLVKDASSDGGYKRVLKTRPCSWHEAGDRTGYLPDRLPLDGSAFIEAYNKGYQAAIAAARPAPAAKQQVTK